MKTLILIRGVSGSGKTTLANLIAAPYDKDLDKFKMISADDYFYNINGDYRFNSNLLQEAHHECMKITRVHMRWDVDTILVHNTFTTESQMKPYLDLAEKYGYDVVSLVVENRHGNESVHDVLEKTLVRQESRLRNSIKLR